MSFDFDTDIDFGLGNAWQFQRAANDYFIKEKNATPRQLLPFLGFLDHIVNVASETLTEKGAGAATGSLKLDIKNWRDRSKGYRTALELVMKTQPDESTLIEVSVIGPLFHGVYPGVDHASIPDMMEPLRIVHGVDVGTEHMDQAWDSLGSELGEAYAEAAEAVGDQAKAAADNTEKQLAVFAWILDQRKPWRLPLVAGGVLLTAGAAYIGVQRLAFGQTIRMQTDALKVRL